MAEMTKEERSLWKKKLMDEMQVAKNQVIPYFILGELARRTNLPSTNLSFAGFAILISIMVFLISSAINAISGFAVPGNEIFSLILPAFLAGLGLWLIRVVEEAIFIPNMKLFSEMLIDTAGFEEFYKYFQKVFHKKKQLISAAIFSIVGIFTASALCSEFTYLSNNPGFYTCILFFSAVIGLGAYFAIQLPLIIGAIARHKLNHYHYNPAQSELVQTGMGIVGKLALGTGVAATGIMILLFIASPWNKQPTFQISLVWLIFIWGLTTYTFLVPFIFMSKAIMAEKKNQIERLSRLIEQYDSRIEELNSDEVNKLRQLIELRQSVYNSRNSPIESSSFLSYLTSMILPTFSFLAGSLDSIRDLLNNITH